MSLVSQLSSLRLARADDRAKMPHLQRLRGGGCAGSKPAAAEAAPEVPLQVGRPPSKQAQQEFEHAPPAAAAEAANTAVSAAVGAAARTSASPAAAAEVASTPVSAAVGAAAASASAHAPQADDTVAVLSELDAEPEATEPAIDLLSKQVKSMGRQLSGFFLGTSSSAVSEQDREQVAILSKLDEELIAKLSAGDIRLVRSAWLLLPSVTKMRKRQELETIEEQKASHDVSPLLSCDEAAALVRRGTRSAAVLSHGWLLSGDCDPKAERLALVKQALAEYPHIEGLFWE